MIEIRFGTSGDFEQIYQLLLQLTPETVKNKSLVFDTYNRSIIYEGHLYLCAVDGKTNKIIGYCSLSFRSSLWQQGYVANLHEIIVDHHFRRNGIGALLIAETIEIARETGCKQIEMDSAFHRQEAFAFYYELGFSLKAQIFSLELS